MTKAKGAKTRRVSLEQIGSRIGSASYEEILDTLLMSPLCWGWGSLGISDRIPEHL
jgi:hypothetical protein